MTNVIYGSAMITCRFFHSGKISFKNIVIRKPVRVFNVPTGKRISPGVQLTEGPEKVLSVAGVVKEDLVRVPAIIKKPEENVATYEKLSEYDSRLIKTLAIIKNRTKREKSGKILLEGKRLINDALSVGMKMTALYFSRVEDLEDIKIKNPEEVRICKVLYRTLQVWSSLTTCPGVLGIFKRPSAEELNVLSQSTLPVTVLCNNIREPGNLGSIIRNAAAAGCENVLLTKGCVDPWEPKVLRAGCGGHFRIPIVNNIDWSQISNYIPSNSTLYIADSSAEIEEVNLNSDFISFDESEETEESSEEKRYVTYNEDNQPILVDESFNSRKELEPYKDITLPCHLYSSLKYPNKNIVLCIGGETHGVDPKIIKLACEFGGKKIKIPMDNGVESLNSTFAMTIILYEIKRQLSQTYITK